MIHSSKENPNLDSIQNTEHPIGRMIEGRLPLRERLETIHQATIIAHGKGCNQAGKS